MGQGFGGGQGVNRGVGGNDLGSLLGGGGEQAPLQPPVQPPQAGNSLMALLAQLQGRKPGENWGRQSAASFEENGRGK